MGHIEPTEDQLKAFASDPQDGPIVMVNLLRFKGKEGKALHQRYLDGTRPLVEKAGGRMLYRGEGKLTVIGPEPWEEVVMIEYPSRAVLMDLLQSMEYQAVAHYRSEALADSCTVLTKALPT
jgi:uncharacterized protein (DUF1330 family)